MIKSLVYFDDAENEGFPVMLSPIDWSEVKDFFSRTQKILLKNF